MNRTEHNGYQSRTEHQKGGLSNLSHDLSQNRAEEKDCFSEKRPPSMLSSIHLTFFGCLLVVLGCLLQVARVRAGAALAVANASMWATKSYASPVMRKVNPLPSHSPYLHNTYLEPRLSRL